MASGYRGGMQHGPSGHSPRHVGRCPDHRLVFLHPHPPNCPTGRIDVTVEDTTGGRLPAVRLDLSGAAGYTQLSDVLGQAHFLNLPVGAYTIRASRAGFATRSSQDLHVIAGSSVALSIRLEVAGPDETVDVTASAPVPGMKKESTTTNVSLEELQNIPGVRDPWAVLQTVPTVYVDRVNVGGADSHLQANYVGKGAPGTDNTWAIDGVPVTDMGSTGSSAFYYDFDSFEEMAVTTGGGDVRNGTAGVQLNLVLKKGSATPHGSARIYFENQGLQATNVSEAWPRASAGWPKEAIESTSTPTTASIWAARLSKASCGRGAHRPGPTSAT